jgi:hypothetical protein
MGVLVRGKKRQLENRWIASSKEFSGKKWIFFKAKFFSQFE